MIDGMRLTATRLDVHSRARPLCRDDDAGKTPSPRRPHDDGGAGRSGCGGSLSGVEIMERAEVTAGGGHASAGGRA